MLSGLLKKLTGSTSVSAIEHDEPVRADGESNCIVVDVREPHEFRSGQSPRLKIARCADSSRHHPAGRFRGPGLSGGRALWQSGGRLP